MSNKSTSEVFRDLGCLFGDYSWAVGFELSHDDRQESAPCHWLKCRFIRADVTVRPLGTGDAALVEVVDRGRRADGVVRRVNRRAAWAERHRLGGAAVVLQGTEYRVAVDARTGGIGIAEVSAAIGDGTGAVASRWAVGDDRVLKRHRVTGVADAAAPVAGALLPEKVLLLTVSVPWVVDAAAVRSRRYCRRRCCCSRSPCRCCRCRRRCWLALLPEKVLLLTVTMPSRVVVV